MFSGPQGMAGETNDVGCTAVLATAAAQGMLTRLTRGKATGQAANFTHNIWIELNALARLRVERSLCLIQTAPDFLMEYRLDD